MYRSSPRIHFFLAPLLALTLSSCGLFGGDERPVYQGAEYYKNLEVPPDLTTPDTADQLRVPEPTAEAIQRFKDNNKLETVISPRFDGVRVVSYAGESWIEVDNTVEQVWPELKRFWENEGIEIVDDRPELGYMETEWTEKLSPDAGYFKSLLQKFEPDFKDKFRVRVERIDDDAKTRLYISHSRIERVVSGEYNEDFIWVTRPGNIEVERELISRMALYTGLDREHALALMENYRPYSSLVKIDSTDSTALMMKGSMDFVWKRSLRALNRMLMLDIVEDRPSSSISFVAGKLSDEALDIQTEEDDLAKSSWLMQLFTDDDEDVSRDSKRQYRLQLSDIGGLIKIQVIDAENTLNTDEDGEAYGTALAEQIRDQLVENLE